MQNELVSDKVVNKVVRVWHMCKESMNIDAHIIMQIYAGGIWDRFMPKFETMRFVWSKSEFEEVLSKINYNKNNWKFEFIDIYSGFSDQISNKYMNVTVYYKEISVRIQQFFDEEMIVKTVFLLSHEEDMLKLLKLAKLKIIEKYHKGS